MAIAFVVILITIVLLILGIVKEALYTVFPPLKWVVRLGYVILWIVILRGLILENDFGNDFFLDFVYISGATFFYWCLVFICNFIMLPVSFIFDMFFRSDKESKQYL